MIRGRVLVPLSFRTCSAHTQRNFSILGPRAYLWGSKAYNKLRPWLVRTSEENEQLRVRDVLENRRPERQRIFSLQEDNTAYDALCQMLEHRISCVVVQKGDNVRGILTETDYLVKVAVRERNHRLVRCEDIMTPVNKTAYVLLDNTVESCMSIMAEMNCHHLPVLSLEAEGAMQLEGVVSLPELSGLTKEQKERNRKRLYERLGIDEASLSEMAEEMQKEVKKTVVDFINQRVTSRSGKSSS
eukprot:gb/GECG01013058.1/.p1 GENE.gb/GECG01013058.1/~~gb/GECG01013058.1/.p1  ORF type:complete len:243 (+),score=22.54 gb/GECG01013058.1/:1-729(+)